MKNALKLLIPVLACGIVATGIVSGTVSALAAPSEAFATISLQEGAAAARCDGCPADLFGENGVFRRITNIILYVVGVVAVIMLIIGGIRYVVSGGDSKKVTDAKNTVLYAIIGLAICFLAFAIVNSVMKVLPGDGA